MLYDQDTGEVIGASKLVIPDNYTKTALLLPPDTSYEQWEAIGKQLQKAGESVMWWLGDWWAFGDHRYGERASQALDPEFPWSYQTCRDAAWVARKIETSRRRDTLGFSHHKEVACLAPERQEGLLSAASDENWTVRELRQAVQRTKAIANVQTIPEERGCTIEDLASLTGKQFGTIYADPPWLYGNQGTRAATGNHYGGMTIEEICALPVAGLTAENAHCHLWTTNGFLREAFDVLEAWGFTYKSCFIWVKPQMGIGNYWRVSHEFMLLGVKGSMGFADRGQKSWREFERNKHSAKPEQIRQIIEKTSPGPYLELFGRRPADGWVVWGNQIERNMFEAAVA